MASVAGGNGDAFDAEVLTDEDVERLHDFPVTEPVQRHLDAVAEAAEAAVGNVEQMIKDLQESLPERRAIAEQARAEADKGRAE